VVGREKLDLGTWVDTDKYKEPTKRRLRFYLFDGNWDDFRRIFSKVDKVYAKMA